MDFNKETFVSDDKHLGVMIMVLTAICRQEKTFAPLISELWISMNPSSHVCILYTRRQTPTSIQGWIWSCTESHAIDAGPQVRHVRTPGPTCQDPRSDLSRPQVRPVKTPDLTC